MDIMQVREYLLSLPYCDESQPFGEDCVVFKVGGKMFACLSFVRPEYIAVKCDPQRAAVLRDEYPEITPAWHFNKKHWNDIRIDLVGDGIVTREIRHSYMLVVKKNVTPGSLRAELLAAAAEAGIRDAEETI